MSVEHEQELGELRAHALQVAELISQNGHDSPIGPGGMQVRVTNELRPHGPNPHLKAIEGALSNLVATIDIYLAAR